MGQIISNPGGGSADLFVFNNRADHSVNHADIQNPFSDTPVMRTRTGVSSAGGFNGAGLGNKAILGFDTGDGLPLGSLATISWTTTNMTPFITSPWPIPYFNFVIDLLGTDIIGNGFNIGVIDPQAGAGLFPGSSVLNPDGSTTWNWSAALSNNIQIVNSTVVSPKNPVNIPPSNIIGPGTPWQNRSFTIAQVLLTYPAAVLRRRSSLDGGMPKTTVTTPFMIGVGDSGYNAEITQKIGPVLINGVAV